MTLIQNSSSRLTRRWVVSLLAFWLLTLCLQAQDTNFNFQATQAAADKGDPTAQYKLACAYYQGGKTVKKDYVLSAKYMRLAADQGYSPAQVTLGSFYGKGLGVRRSLATAISWYRKAANQGNALGEYAMGNFYLKGQGVTNDVDEAIKWWNKAAAQDEPNAQAALGQLYLVPSPTTRTNHINYPEAIRFLHLAVAHNSADAMNNLGVAYENGLGVQRDFGEAARWYRQAAERDNAQAQANLGQLYFDGRGVTNDLVQAYMWFKLSARNGSFLGSQGLGCFQNTTLLTPKQLADAEQMVLDFHPLADSSKP
ncbi:MAG: SEL1-like repeat protein [Verrucomicrobiota bacterium]